MKKLVLLSLIGAIALPLYAKPPLTKGETDPVMKDLDPFMIKVLRGSKKGSNDKIKPGKYGSEGSIVDMLKEPKFNKLIKKHDLKLFNGPMVGAVTPTSARIWIRTAGPASFKIAVDKNVSKTIKTSAENDFAGIAVINGLKPFTEYKYTVILDGKKITAPSFRFKTYPEADTKETYSIAFGACSRYVPQNEPIWRKIADTKPLAYLGLGDNVYIDATMRRDVQRLHYYRRMLRKEYREFIAQTAMYAVWDDHDFGANDSAGGPGFTKDWKILNFNVFKENWVNPFYGNEPKAPGTWHNFTIGDVEVFMLDGRMYRSDQKDKNDSTNTMLGPEQKQWLLNALKNSKAKFKVLGSGTMWHDLADKGGKDSWAGKRFKAERDEIFDLIDAEKIGGVILLAGDRHRTEIWKSKRESGYPLYEFLSAKVTNLHTHHTRKQAEWSYNEGNFWGELEFNTSIQDPTVTFKALNQDGKEIHSFTLKLSEISHK